MNKYLVVILMVFGLSSCNDKNEHYYMSNPKELEKAIKACPNQKPPGLNCDQVEQIGKRMNSLAYQLQSNPPGFGNKILALQQTIAQQKIELKANGSNEELKSSLQQNQKDLNEFLAVVKWLESPESK
jgi:hypothetical protein